MTYNDTIRKLIDHELAAKEVVPSKAAARIIDQLRKSYPEVLNEWFEDSAVTWMADQIGRLMSSYRSRAVHQEPVARFQKATEDQNLLLLDTWHCVNEENVRRRLADMTGKDHAFVADSYKSRAQANLMMEAFHRALAKKVGSRRTADVLSEEQVQRILDNLNNKATKSSKVA